MRAGGRLEHEAQQRAELEDTKYATELFPRDLADKERQPAVI